MAAIAVCLTLTVTYPVTLGVMIGLLLLYVVTAYLVVAGLVWMRVGEDERDPVGVGITPGRRSLRCAVLGHKEVFSPRDDAQPSGFRSRRCGATALVPSTSAAAGDASCRSSTTCTTSSAGPTTRRSTGGAASCGKRRFTAPTSAGESMDATRSALLWVKRYDD